jgi:hypothetical protein
MTLLAAGSLPPLPVRPCEAHFVGRVKLNDAAILNNQGD